MKRVVFILISCMIILSLFGCKQVPASITTATPTEPTQVSTKTVYIPVSEQWTYVDGSTQNVTYVYSVGHHLLEIQHAYSNGDTKSCIATCDEHGWVTRIEHMAYGGTKTYTYDEYGRIVSCESGNTTWKYSYDAEGRRTKVERPVDNGVQMGTYVSEYVYKDGRLAEINEYDLLGEKYGGLTYEYDDKGRVITETQHSQGCEPVVKYYSYSEDGLVHTIEYDSQTKVLTYDIHGNLLCVEYTASGQHYKCEYTYQAVEISEDLQWKPLVDDQFH